MANLLNSIRFRVSITATLLLGLILMLFTGFLYRGITQSQQEAFDASLFNFTVEVAQGLSIDPSGNLQVGLNLLTERRKLLPFELGRSIIQVLDSRGNLVASSNPRIQLRARTSDINEVKKSAKAGISDLKVNEIKMRAVHYPLQYGRDMFLLQVAAPTTDLDISQAQLRSSIFYLFPAALLTMALVCFLTLQQAFKPLKRIVQRAHMIRANNLSERMPTPQETELRDLGVTLNSMLSSLEQAFLSQEQFVADASHQLKTPLAVIKAHVESLAKKGLAQNGIERAQIDEIVQEIDSLARIVDQLLVLAKFDGGLVEPEFEHVRLDEVVLESLKANQTSANQKEISLDFRIREDRSSEPDDFEINGNFELLKTLFSNVIDNALKYSAPNTSVRVELLPGREPQVRIIDSGKGILEQNRDKIFDRFFRSSRDLASPGVGLGLSIVKKIAALHSSHLDVQSSSEGSTFLISFPKA